MPADRSAILNMLKRVHLFTGMEDDVFETAAGLMEPIEFPSGSIIYAEEEAPDYFYFIIEGQVRISRSPSTLGKAPNDNLLEGNDYFGEEVLEYSWPRQTSARAETDIKLVRISVPKFIALIEAVPPLAKRLQSILDSFRLRLKTHFSWLDPDETIYFIARKHIFFLFTMTIAPALAGLVALLAFGMWYLASQMMMSLILTLGSLLFIIIWLIWSYIDWTNDYYIITNKRVVYQERVILLYDSRQESPMEAVQSTTISSSQWGRWLGYGNLAIRTYIGTILFRNIANPEHIQAIVQEHQLRSQYRETHTEIKRIQSMIEKRIRLGPDQPSIPRPKKTPESPDPMRSFLSSMFHLRYEMGGAIVYRTHWLILLKRTFLPAALFFCVVGFFVYSALHRFELVSLQATCGVSFLFGLMFFGWWLYKYMDWHYDVYLITNDQVIDVNKKPLGHEERQAAPIKNILSIEYKRIGVFGLLFNFGTVYIRVGDQKLTFDEVLNPSEVQRELFHRLARKNYEEQIKQAEGDRKRMAEWFATYDEWKRENPSARPSKSSTREGF